MQFPEGLENTPFTKRLATMWQAVIFFSQMQGQTSKKVFCFCRAQVPKKHILWRFLVNLWRQRGNCLIWAEFAHFLCKIQGCRPWGCRGTVYWIEVKVAVLCAHKYMHWNLLLIKALNSFWYFKHQILTRICSEHGWSDTWFYYRPINAHF